MTTASVAARRLGRSGVIGGVMVLAGAVALQAQATASAPASPGVEMQCVERVGGVSQGGARAGSVSRVCDTTKVRIIVRSLGGLHARLDSLMQELDQEPIGSPDRLRIDKALRGVMLEFSQAMPPFEFPQGGVYHRVPVLAGGGGPRLQLEGWIGINTDAVPHREQLSPIGHVIQYLQYPPIISVDPDSPAEKAGVAHGDILLAYNGTDVVANPINLTSLLKPQQSLSVRIRRGGDTRDVTMIVANAPARRRSDFAGGGRVSGGPPGEIFFSPDGMGGLVFQPGLLGSTSVLGALLSPVNAESGRVYGVESGLLVNSAPEGTPARESGLRGGDVIVRAGSERVASLDQLRVLLKEHMGDRELAVEIIRDKKTQPLTLKWSAR